MNYFVTIISLVMISCGSMKTLSNGKQIDNRLIGIWTGFESDKQIESMSKKWEMTRNDDGTFVLDFKYTQDGKTFNSIETGNWWIENGKFYEFHEESGGTDVYEYTVIDKNHIKFKSVNISIDMNVDSYEFIDSRKIIEKDKKSKNKNKQGVDF
ncbi:MAG: hypothetical protein LBE36_09945 [Flavobacteriaceae bacterium]|nr:hypothetical protein [Flavobacteriaceae bacterium]